MLGTGRVTCHGGQLAFGPICIALSLTRCMMYHIQMRVGTCGRSRLSISRFPHMSRISSELFRLARSTETRSTNLSGKPEKRVGERLICYHQLPGHYCIIYSTLEYRTCWQTEVLLTIHILMVQS